MIIGYNDWDAALDEARMRRIESGNPLPGDIPPKQEPLTLADYGRSVTFTLDEILGK